ncbi:hypothetical protein [Desulfurobacterium sp.]
MVKHYLTDLEALNYHGYDWHSFAFRKKRNYPEEVRKWAGDFGVINEGNREVANPVRAFLDHLFYTIRFMGLVPTYRVEDLLFSEKEEREILQKVDEILEPILNKKERELLRKWKMFNSGERYEPDRKPIIERKTWKRRFGKNRDDEEDFRDRIRKAFGF